MTEISIDDFLQIKMQIGTIMSVRLVEGSEKLLHLEVDFGEEMKNIITGIKKHYPDVSSLVGRQATFVTNLPERTMMGHQSQAMILAARDGENIALIVPDQPIRPGSCIE